MRENTYSLGDINDGDLVFRGSGSVLGASNIRHESPDLVEVQSRAMELVRSLVEVAHTNLSEVSGMVLVEVGSVVMLTTGVTATTGVLAVLADTTMTSGHVSSLFAVLVKSGRLWLHDK